MKKNIDMQDIYKRAMKRHSDWKKQQEEIFHEEKLKEERIRNEQIQQEKIRKEQIATKQKLEKARKKRKIIIFVVLILIVLAYIKVTSLDNKTKEQIIDKQQADDTTQVSSENTDSNTENNGSEVASDMEQSQNGETSQTNEDVMYTGSASFEGMTATVTVVNGTTCTFEFDNQTDTDMNIGGWEANQNVCLVTESGEYWTEFDVWMGVDIPSHGKTEKEVNFDDNVTGTPSCVKIDCIQTLVDGLPTFGKSEVLEIQLNSKNTDKQESNQDQNNDVAEVSEDITYTGSSSFQGMTITATAINNTKNKFVFDNQTDTDMKIGGWGASTNVCLTTSDGEFWNKFTGNNGVDLPAHQKKDIEIYFDDSTGTPLSLKIEYIQTLNANSLPGTSGTVEIQLSQS